MDYALRYMYGNVSSTNKITRHGIFGLIWFFDIFFDFFQPLNSEIPRLDNRSSLIF
jgi:hypothetical protein